MRPTSVITVVEVVGGGVGGGKAPGYGQARKGESDVEFHNF